MTVLDIMKTSMMCIFKNKLKQFDNLSKFNAKQAACISSEVENKSLALSYDLIYKIRRDAINGMQYTFWGNKIDDIALHELIQRGFNIDVIESGSGALVYKIMW